MAYDPSVPPSLMTQGIGGTTGLRFFALMWIDPIIDVLEPGYVSNAIDIGMRAGDTFIYKDTNRGEWAQYSLIVGEINADGSADLAFPEIPEEAIPFVEGGSPDDMTDVVVYQGGRQVRIAFPATMFLNTTSPEAYGAEGDWNGTTGTDDTAAVQAAFDLVGKDVYIPAGRSYKLTAPLTITTPKRIFGGGNLVWTAGISTVGALQVSVDGVSLDGINLFNPNELSSSAGGVRPYGVEVAADEFSIFDCLIDTFQNGIAVRSTGEYFNIRIVANRVKDVIGVGLEDRGDGINVTGAQATIMGNIVNSKTGFDSRIGIHCERLSAFRVTDAPHNDALLSVVGNVIYGKFRRGIAVEGCSDFAVTGNTVADGTWSCLEVATGARNGVVSGNTVRWTRTAAETPGAAPGRAPITTYGDMQGIIISDNTVRCMPGSAADAYIFHTGTSDDNRPVGLKVAGNVGRLQALGSFTITGGTLGGGNQITQVTVDGTNLLTAPVAHTGAITSTADAVATAITANSEVSGYIARNYAGRVEIEAVVAGSAHTGKVVAVTVGGNVTYGSVVNMLSADVNYGVYTNGSNADMEWSRNQLSGFKVRGIYALTSVRPTIVGNTLDGVDKVATDGVQSGVAATYSIIKDNIIRRIGGDGIEMANQAGSVVTGNHIDDCNDGIFLSSVTDVVCKNNTFKTISGSRIRGASSTPGEIADNQGQFTRVIFTWNPASIAAGGNETLDVTVPGAAATDEFVVAFAGSLGGLMLTAHYQTTDTVRLTLWNNTAGAIDLGNSNVRSITARKYGNLT